MGRARHQLRDLPRSFSRTQQDRKGRHPKASLCLEFGMDQHQDYDEAAAERPLFELRGKGKTLCTLERQQGRERFFDHFDRRDPGRPGVIIRMVATWRELHPDIWMHRAPVQSQASCLCSATANRGALPVKKEKFNDACMPCHADKVSSAHSAHAPSCGKRGKQVYLLSHAHDCLCAHEPERPFDASAGAGNDHGIQVAERLHHLPQR